MNSNEIIAFVHYRPSFYIFHVHYMLITNDNVKNEFPRAILINDIIENIKIDKNYYQKKTFELIF